MGKDVSELVLPLWAQCPMGGDPTDDCADCVYAGEFRFDSEEKECIPRTDTP